MKIDCASGSEDCSDNSLPSIENGNMSRWELGTQNYEAGAAAAVSFGCHFCILLCSSGTSHFHGMKMQQQCLHLDLMPVPGPRRGHCSTVLSFSKMLLTHIHTIQKRILQSLNFAEPGSEVLGPVGWALRGCRCGCHHDWAYWDRPRPQSGRLQFVDSAALICYAMLHI